MHTIREGIVLSPEHRTIMVERLRDIGNRLTTEEVAAGYGWYRLAHNQARRLARKYGTTTHRAAGVIAALSPNQTWSVNLVMAESALAGNPRGFASAVARAKRILAGGSIIDTFPGPDTGSHKIREFYRAIAGNTNAVVIDRWALRAAWGDDVRVKDLQRKGVYHMVASAYREVAPEFGLSPRDFQAAVWVHVRGGAE
jgi:hypothetical protein